MSELLNKYCSCVFQVKGKEGLKRGKSAKSTSVSPYAVCSTSVYQKKGLKPPGALACKFTKKVLQTYDVETLRGWLVFEDILSRAEAKLLNQEQAATLIHLYLKSKTPKRKVKTNLVKKRSPKSAQRPKVKKERKSPKPVKRSKVKSERKSPKPIRKVK